MTEYHHAASIILVNRAGKLILQKRDNKPGIGSPDMVTAWGGAVEGDETVLQAALREIQEETNLRPPAESFEFFGDYPRDYKIDGKQVFNHVFLLKNVDERQLKIYEGQGYEIVDPAAGATNPLFTDLTNEIIRDYNKLDAPLHGNV